MRLRKTCFVSEMLQSQHRLQNILPSLVCMHCMPLQIYPVWSYEHVEERESVNAQGSCK